MTRYLLFFVFISFSFLVSGQSVLSNGAWHKFAVTETGIYKLTYQDLQSLGINPGDPKKINIYGSGGGMLPQANDANPPQSTDFNPIYISGEEDGSFDPGDYILFYAQGPDKYAYTETTGDYLYENNIYTDTTYYFLGINSGSGKRISMVNSGAPSPDKINSYEYLAVYEKDLLNMVSSGRTWYGERFESGVVKKFSFDIPDLVNNSLLKITSAVMAQSASSADFNLSVNGLMLGTQNIGGVGQGTYDEKGRDRIDEFSISSSLINSPTLELQLSYSKTGSGPSSGYLNYFFIVAERSLKLQNNYTHFRHRNALGLGLFDFEISEAPSDIRVWDVSDPSLIQEHKTRFEGNKALFSVNGGSVKEYIMFGSNTTAPIYKGIISNQNLYTGGSPELLIVTPQALVASAQKLANHRQSQGISTKVVSLEQIYNEFSSGRRDVSAIRNYTKHLYDQGGLKYLLLMGKASFDFKGYLTKIPNQVPSYQSRNSLHPVDSYASDDYFGFLEDDEGEWGEDPAQNHSLDIAVGRLPVENSLEADAVVAKLIYQDQNPNQRGNWKNKIVFVADDGDSHRHEKDVEILTGYVENDHSQYILQKLYLDSYKQIPTATGDISPSATEALLRAIDEGAFIVNYTGHGSETVLTDEHIFDIAMIKELKNLNHLPLFLTATCEFGRHDDPYRKSGAEWLLLNDQGGACALLTTARPVISSSNLLINSAFYEIAFDKQNGEYPLLGDIIKYTKNNSLNGVDNRNFILLGDPSSRLDYPEKDIDILSINGQTSEEQDTLKAFQLVEMTGQVSQLGQVDENFEGTLFIKVFDKPVEKQTFGNEGTKLKYTEFTNLIFQGEATIVDGSFSFQFVVPKSINYAYGSAKVSLYAISDSGQDANGSFTEFLVGGSDPSFADDTPPALRLYMDDTSFKNGGLTGSHTKLVIQIFDENGVNLSQSQPGHELMAILDDSISYQLSTYYNAKIDDYQTGWVEFPLSNLKEGTHNIEVFASDTHNNRASDKLSFRVGKDALQMENLLNYPNPFSKETNITFDHNRAGTTLTIDLVIYSQMGDVILENTYTITESSTQISGITWDGKIRGGQKTAAGLYTYRLNVRSSDGTKSTGNGKLIVTN